jgi:hypothetical protein
MSIMPATSTVPGRAAYAIVNLPSKNFTVRQRMELADTLSSLGVRHVPRRFAGSIPQSQYALKSSTFRSDS